MTKEQILLKINNGGNYEADFETMSMDDVIWIWRQLQMNNSETAAGKAGIAKAIRVITQSLKNFDHPFWYMALVKDDGVPADFPYQESSHFGTEPIDTEKISIRLFGSKENADAYASSINEEAKAMDKPIAVSRGFFEAGFGRTPMQMFEQMNVKELVLGVPDESEEEVTVNIKPILEAISARKTEIDFFTIAPELTSAINIHEQAYRENRPDDELEELQTQINFLCTQVNLSCALTEEDYHKEKLSPITEERNGESFIPCFSDKSEMHFYFGRFVRLGMKLITLEDIVDRDKTMLLNGEWFYSRESLERMLLYTKTANLALDYIYRSYNSSEAEENLVDEEECYRILSDIIKAPNVRKEFYSAISSHYETDAESGEQYIVTTLDFPQENMVAFEGKTAERLVSSGLCAHPAAAYHVLALLCNDTDGSAKLAFENAELYR